MPENAHRVRIEKPIECTRLLGAEDELWRIGLPTFRIVLSTERQDNGPEAWSQSVLFSPPLLPIRGPATTLYARVYAFKSTKLAHGSSCKSGVHLLDRCFNIRIYLRMRYDVRTMYRSRCQITTYAKLFGRQTQDGRLGDGVEIDRWDTLSCTVVTTPGEDGCSDPAVDNIIYYPVTG